MAVSTAGGVVRREDGVAADPGSKLADSVRRLQDVPRESKGPTRTGPYRFMCLSASAVPSECEVFDAGLLMKVPTQKPTATFEDIQDYVTT